MWKTMLAGVLALLPAAAHAGSAFDGAWTVNLACPDTDAGARGYTYVFGAVIKDGTLHGERGSPGSPGYYAMDGDIGADGTATLAAHGIRGNQRNSTGSAPAMSTYSNRVKVTFSGAKGSGQTLDNRACPVSFVKS